MKVLISGAGIAGPTLAYRLNRFGIEATLVEQAPQLRAGEYIIAFCGAGFDIAEHMGLLPGVRRSGYRVNEVRVVNRRGNRISGFSVDALARLTNDRYISLPRSEVAALIYAEAEDTVETTFGNSVSRIEQDAECVHIEFDHGPPRDYDLVIGTDGLHSKIRELVFGPKDRFERYLGYRVAAFARGTGRVMKDVHGSGAAGRPLHPARRSHGVPVHLR